MKLNKFATTVNILNSATPMICIFRSSVEESLCIEVTPELYAKGITHCVNSWMQTDANGDAEATELCIGDFLIISESGVYRASRDEIMETCPFA